MVYSVYVSPDFTEYRKNVGPAQIEGRNFGLTIDNNACIEEGVSRAKNIRSTEVLKVAVMEAFVEQCLKTSRPVNNFCDSVPYIWGVGDWRKKQCINAGMQETETACESVFVRKRQYCIFDKK
jgi:hypothetical protein